jgi:hypothetical protein
MVIRHGTKAIDAAWQLQDSVRARRETPDLCESETAVASSKKEIEIPTGNCHETAGPLQLTRVGEKPPEGAMSATVLIATLLFIGTPLKAGLFDDFDDVGELGDHILSGGVGVDGIPAMNNPTFVSPEQIGYVQEDDLVLGMFVGGVAKAYPENLGWRHEIINDVIGGQPISVTFCPLTGTGLVFETADENGEQYELGVSGLLINSNLVMYDRRDFRTLYPQMIYTGITGDFKDDKLELLPVVETTYRLWKQMYPETLVAQSGTGLEAYGSRANSYALNPTIYERYPYVSSLGDYRISNDYIIFPWTTSEPDLSLFQIKDVVLGVCRGDQTTAYPFLTMPSRAVINDEIAGLNLVVIYDAANRTALPYDRTVNGQVLSFYQVDSSSDLPLELMDVETRSRWDMRGRAVEGPLEGSQLQQVPAYNSMWFAWSTYWPDTAVWDGEGIIDDPPEITAVAESIDHTPVHFSLAQNYPNPFNPFTQIEYRLPGPGRVRLSVFNASGQRVALW